MEPRRATDTAGTRVALALAFGATLLYVLTWQGPFWGDGLEFCNAVEGRLPASNHLLYFPAAGLLRDTVGALFGLDSLQCLLLLSSLCGGACVGLTYAAGRRLLGDPRAALFAALSLAVLPAFWFHATVAELHTFHALGSFGLLWSFLRWSDGRLSRPKDFALHAAGHALSPATHLSGLSSAGVSFLLGVFHKPSRKLIAAAALGLAVFYAAYQLARARNPDFFRYYEGNFKNSYYPALLRDPSLALSYLSIAGSELLGLTAPASAFLVAGLRVQARRNVKVTWLFVLWIAGYLAICAPIGDRGVGGYYAPTFAIQAWMAALAFTELVSSPIRVVLALAAAGATLVLPLEGDGVRCLVALGACAAVTAIAWSPGARPAASPVRFPAWLLVLPVACGLLTFKRDVLPRRFNACAAKVALLRNVTKPDDLIVVAEPDGYTRTKEWRLRLAMAGRRDVLSIGVLDLPLKEQRTDRVKGFRDTIRKAVKSRAVWLVHTDPFPDDSPAGRATVEWILMEFTVTDADPPVPGVVRISPRPAGGERR